MVSIFDENNDIEEDNALMGKVIILYFFIPYDAVSLIPYKSFLIKKKLTLLQPAYLSVSKNQGRAHYAPPKYFGVWWD